MPAITKTFAQCFICEHFYPEACFRILPFHHNDACARCELKNDLYYHKLDAEIVADAETVFNLIADRTRGASRDLLRRKLAINYVVVQDGELHSLTTDEREADRDYRLGAALRALLDIGHIEEANGRYHTVVNPVWLNPPEL